MLEDHLVMKNGTLFYRITYLTKSSIKFLDFSPLILNSYWSRSLHCD